MASACLLIAAFEPEGILALMIPFVALMIPIVAMLIKHQQRMTEILNGNTSSIEVQALRQEVAELRSVVEQHHLALQSRYQATPEQELQRLQALKQL